MKKRRRIPQPQLSFIAGCRVNQLFILFIGEKSAGVGRTGTLLSIFNLDLILRETLKKKGDEKKVRISVFGVVRRLREQRWGMVNTAVKCKLYPFFLISSL